MEAPPTATLAQLHADCETISSAMYQSMSNKKLDMLQEMEFGFLPAEGSRKTWRSTLLNFWTELRLVFGLGINPARNYESRRNAALQLELNYCRIGRHGAFLGYLEPVTADAVPVAIPLERLEGVVDWDKDALDWLGVRYADVRLVPESDLPRLHEVLSGTTPPPGTPQEPVPPAPAPPSSAPAGSRLQGNPIYVEFRKLAARLQSQGIIRPTMSRKDQIKSCLQYAEKGSGLAAELQTMTEKTFTRWAAGITTTD